LFHFTNAGATSRHDLAAIALERDPHSRARLTPIVKRDFSERAARPLNGALDNSKAATVFNWQAEPWQSAVQRAADQIVAEGLKA